MSHQNHDHRDREEAKTGDGSNPSEPITVKVRRLISPVSDQPESPQSIGGYRPSDRFDAGELPAPVCDCCGFVIETTDQQCTARPAGVCSA